MAVFAQLAVAGRGITRATEQRICNKFCFKFGKPTTKKYQLLQQEYAEDAIARTQVFDWFRRFKDGRTSAESDRLSGRPSTSRNEEMIAKVRTVVRHNRRLTVERYRMSVASSLAHAMQF